MSYYVYSEALAYVDYLKAKSFVDCSNAVKPKILIDIPLKLRELIISPDAFAANNIEYQEQPDKSKPFDRLSYPVGQMLSSKGEINAMFHNAYSKFLIQIDITKLNTEEINKLFRFKTDLNPVGHTGLSKMAFIDGDYSKAKDEAEKAIQEYEKLPKLKPDWMLYFILGVIYLGFVDCDFSLVDLEKAEQIFIKALDLIPQDDIFTRARAYMSAGWAAYCQGNFKAAEEHVQNTIELKVNLAEARFIMAKILFAVNDIEKAFIYLGKAIETNPFYVLKAAGEQEFQQHEDKLINIFITDKDKYIILLNSLLNDYNRRISENDVKAVLRKEINRVLSDKSLYNILYHYKKLRNDYWVVSQGDFTIRVNDEIVIKDAGLFSKQVVKKVVNEFKVKAINYNIVGEHHGIKLALSFNFIENDNGSYYLGRIPVTQALWYYVMEKKPFTSKDLFYPIFEITWYDCIRFCNKLSALLNLPPYYHIKNNYFPVNWHKGTIECNYESEGFRLPTEEEWGFAAKGGKKTHNYLYSGSDDIDEVGWYNTNSKRKLQMVAQKKPNELGLYDMSGNVWEWCWNQYKDTDRRVLRGGAFFYAEDQCVVYSIGHAKPDNPGMTNGFRLARSIKEPIDD